jgi:hypothetical protein
MRRFVMDKFCLSCGMPLDGKSTMKYCKYCTDEKGELKSREAVREGVAAWLMMFTPDPNSVDMKARAESYLNAMPAWAKK